MNGERFDLLMEKHLAADLSAVERHELKQLLAADPALRAEYVSLLTQAFMLRGIHRKQNSDSARLELKEIMSAPDTDRRLAKRLPPVRRRRLLPNWMLAAAAAIALAVTGAYFSGIWRRDLAPFVVAAGAENEVRAEDVVGRQLITQAGASLRVKYADGSSVKFAENTRAVLEKILPGKLVAVEAGKLLADITPQSAEHPMRIKSLHGEIVVLGTQFWLKVVDAHMGVQMLKGAVELKRADGKSLQLKSGQYSLMTPKREMTSQPIPFVNGKLLHQVDFKQERQFWSATQMDLSVVNAVISEKKMVSLRADNPPRSTWCYLSGNLNAAMGALPERFVVEFSARFRSKAMPTWIVFRPNVKNSVPVASDAAVPPIKSSANPFKSGWNLCCLEIQQATDTNGKNTVRMNKFVNRIPSGTVYGGGELIGFHVTAFNVAAEIADVRIYEMLPVDIDELKAETAAPADPPGEGGSAAE